jgi:hypothetical protein
MPLDMMNAIDFEVETRPIYSPEGEIDPQFGRGVYRTDTNELLSVCGPAYHPVQYGEILDPVFSALDEMGYELEERKASQHALYDLQGKKGAWISSETTDNGAVMKTTIITGDFIEPTGAGLYMDQGPDTNFFQIDVLSSHNSKLATRVGTKYLRVRCMNGMTSELFGVSAYGKHTANFKMNDLTGSIGRAIEGMATDADRFGLYAKTFITYDEASEFIKRTIGKQQKPKFLKEITRQVVSTHDKIMELFTKEDRTVWGLYNAMTNWQTHGDMKKSADEITGRLGREAKVATTLRSNEWANLIA